jgi:hypothetical protein
MDSSYDYLDSEELLDLFAEGFAAGTFPIARWNHAAHVTMAGCYLQLFPRPEATRRIRDGIRHYNECQGTKNTPDSGYHETLTLFWIAMVAHVLEQCDPALTRLQKARAVVETFAARRDLFREYYSFDVVRSREARRDWIPPDVKPLPAATASRAKPESLSDTPVLSPAPVSHPA